MTTYTHNIVEVEAQVIALVGEEYLKGITVVPIQQQPNGLPNTWNIAVW